MKTTVKVLLIAAAVLVAAGIIGAIVYAGNGAAARNTAFADCDGDYYYNAPNAGYGYAANDETQNGYAANNRVWQDSDENDTDDWDGGYYCDTDGYYNNRGMMGGYYNQDTANGEKLELEVLEQNVNEYIGGFDEKLAVSDIFVFEDSDYYFSIVEEDTGLGAFELLVNPYTGDVYPEMGPGMMWNTKYDMHASSDYGMMNGRGMMGRYTYSDPAAVQNDNAQRNEITFNEALGIAGDYLQNGYTVSGEGHEFYGYYTFHTQLNGEEAGMMSVNGFTGDVWYHTWHGQLSEVISRLGH